MILRVHIICHDMLSNELTKYFATVAWISRHTVVCRSPLENGARLNGVSILTGTTKLQFSHICSSVMSYTNLQWRLHFKSKENLPKHTQDMSKQTFKKISLFFSYS